MRVEARAELPAGGVRRRVELRPGEMLWKLACDRPVWWRLERGRAKIAGRGLERLVPEGSAVAFEPCETHRVRALERTVVLELRLERPERAYLRWFRAAGAAGRGRAARASEAAEPASATEAVEAAPVPEAAE